ncbi:MAG: MOSC domain-containing protein [Porticoccaceae bacterium]|nr:MOSC domain-containing protein [Porticoccaceae bacterium]
MAVDKRNVDNSGVDNNEVGKVIGSIDRLDRYPVKSMRGEQLDQAFVGYSGIYGDRIYAFKSPAAPAFFPYFTGRDKQEMLLYTPRFRHPEHARQPHSWAEAETYSIGITPLFGSEDELVVDVETPEGQVLAIGDPLLMQMLANNTSDSPGGNKQGPELSLYRSDRALTDGRPISLISVQTVQQLSEEVGIPIDGRRFRANISIDLAGMAGFSEDDFVGRTLRLGDRVVVSIVERDPRCEMITFDPDTGETEPAILRQVSKAHNRLAGVYAAVLVEGLVEPGDSIYLES